MHQTGSPRPISEPPSPTFSLLSQPAARTFNARPPRAQRRQPDSTASGIAYKLSMKTTEAKNVLVFDFGSGKSNVSPLRVRDNVVENFAFAGGRQSGGNDIDNRIVADITKGFKCTSKQEISSDYSARLRLRAASEHMSTISLPSRRLLSRLTRSSRKPNDDIFRSNLKHVQEVLKDANVTKSSVDEVFLVGGSSQILKVQQMLSKYFDRKVPNMSSVNLDEAIVYGAAVQGTILYGMTLDKVKDLRVLDKGFPLPLRSSFVALHPIQWGLI
ncbi:70-kilodalton heat shock protein [Linnemannia schmuckeri]|uniref:70-kilodalton heat shock protein n=1 Tax=Linnemannia schmuckeri TaxID=64567 RepID=A0A9P5VAH1_9FUNG|nr:70-kilodalton heat shock protein [Linnemannia schmuckeri]